jgi:hypothetical protein
VESHDAHETSAYSATVDARGSSLVVLAVITIALEPALDALERKPELGPRPR